MEEIKILESSGELSSFGSLILEPLSPLKGLFSHADDQVLEDLDRFETLDGSPVGVRDELERVGLLGRLESNLLLDEGVHFALDDQALADVDSQAKHRGDNELMTLEGTSASVVKGLVGDGFKKGFDTGLEGLW